MNTEWQPIETAPKDGTLVLVYDNEWGIKISWYGKDYNDESYAGWLWGDGDEYSCGYYYNTINPTHWMPLPKLPKQ